VRSMMIKSCLLTIAITTLIVGWDSPHLAVAQAPERPTNCTEAMDVGTIFIGHDCGDVADVLISGRVVIRRPWSHVTSASRSERLRIQRGGTVAPPPAPEATPAPVTAAQLAAPEAIPPRPRAKQRQVEISLNCAAEPERTTITNTGTDAFTVSRITSRAGPAVAGEETLPAINLVVPPGESHTVETGAGADPATGGIGNDIYDDSLNGEGAIVKTTAGTFRRFCRS
jgi:hypothetical protein